MHDDQYQAAMQHYGSLEDVNIQNAWLSIGSFDGVHRGHQQVVRQMVEGAHQEGAPVVVLTFHPHPAVVLGKRQKPFYITTPDQRAALLGELGVDVVITHPFNRDVAAMSARDFMAFVCDHLKVSHLWVGHDFALGRGREGNVDTLRRLGEELGYTVHVISPVDLDGEVISSSRIRSLLSEGDVDQAAHLLGRPFRLEGKVVAGDGRGRTIGIPTANIDIFPDMVLPKSGVYVCQAAFEPENGRVYGAVTNIGIRPTFDLQS
ncbi:MAG: riboflavin biosynthesis protein RibF, partial [Chloroflexota bacterium]